MSKNKETIKHLESELLFWKTRAQSWKKGVIRLSDNVREKKVLERKQLENEKLIGILRDHIDMLISENKELKNDLDNQKTNTIEHVSKLIKEHFTELIQLFYIKKNKTEKCLKKVLDITDILKINIEKKMYPDRESKNIAKNKISNFYKPV